MTKRWRETEFLAAGYVADNGFPLAEATNSSLSGTDIINTPGVTWEIKARRNFDPKKVLRQATGHGGDFQVAVMRPDGSGPKDIDEWPAFMTFGNALRLLRMAGYGDPLPEDPDINRGEFDFLLECLDEAKEMVASKMAGRQQNA